MQGFGPCMSCSHYKQDGACDAYNVIPDPIWSGLNMHRESYEGDGGIIYEPDARYVLHEAVTDNSKPMTDTGRWATLDGQSVWVEAAGVEGGRWVTIRGNPVFIPSKGAASGLRDGDMNPFSLAEQVKTEKDAQDFWNRVFVHAGVSGVNPKYVERYAGQATPEGAKLIKQELDVLLRGGTIKEFNGVYKWLPGKRRMVEAEDLPPGKWRTIDGRRVFIPDDPELAKKAFEEHYAQFDKEKGGKKDEPPKDSGEVRKPENAIAQKSMVAQEDMSALDKWKASLTQAERDEIDKLFDDVNHGTATKDIYSKDGVYTAERLKLHDSIIEGALKGKTAATGRSPLVIMTGGMPGSGKSALAKALPGYKNMVHIDSDDFKMQLPDYKGWNAALLQTEVDDIVDKITERAFDARLDVILDKTMKSPGSYLKTIPLMKTKGYETKVLFMEVSVDTALGSAWKRYKEKGRYVDPVYIASHDHKNLKTFTQIKEMADDWEHHKREGGKVTLVERKKA